MENISKIGMFALCNSVKKSIFSFLFLAEILHIFLALVSKLSPASICYCAVNVCMTLTRHGSSFLK